MASRPRLARGSAMPDAKIVGPESPVYRLAKGLADRVDAFAKANGLSPWEVCMAWANACAMVIGAQRDMPRDKALERLDGLALCMRQTFDLADVKGEG